MKTRMLLSLAALLLLLAGCQVISRTDAKFDAGDFSKAQKIVVTDAAGTECAVLTEKADIDAFAEAVNAEGWKLEDVPAGLEKAGAFTFYQTETITALMDETEAELQKICTFQCYQGASRLTIDIDFAGLSIPFAVPQETADYLSSFWGE